MRTIREATPADHSAFSTLFLELGGDEPVPSLARFCEELMPTTLIAEEGDRTTGYAFYRLLKDAVHLTQLVTAVEARRSGVARALMNEVAQRAAVSVMQLNVRPDNTAAIRLYESLGLTRMHVSQGLKIDWKLIDECTEEQVHLAPLARPILSFEDEELETSWRLSPGILAEQRGRPRRVLRSITTAPGVTALAAFDLGFPGVYPFRAPDLLHARSLLRALREHAPNDALVYVMVEDQRELAAALLGCGVCLNMEAMFMGGRLR